MKQKKNIILLTLFILCSFQIFLSSCSKADCYDRKLYKEHKDDICTMDCPGVIGCDGKTYCNECLANKEGIKVGQ